MKILVLVTATAFSLSTAIVMPAFAEKTTASLNSGATSNQTSFEVMNFKPSYGAPKQIRPTTVDKAHDKRPPKTIFIWGGSFPRFEGVVE